MKYEDAEERNVKLFEIFSVVLLFFIVSKLKDEWHSLQFEKQIVIEKNQTI